MKQTTIAGYINKNKQLNQGKTDMRGTDHCQWFYSMQCQEWVINTLLTEQIFGRGDAQGVKVANRIFFSD